MGLVLLLWWPVLLVLELPPLRLRRWRLKTPVTAAVRLLLLLRVLVLVLVLVLLTRLLTRLLMRLVLVLRGRVATAISIVLPSGLLVLAVGRLHSGAQPCLVTVGMQPLVLQIRPQHFPLSNLHEMFLSISIKTRLANILLSLLCQTLLLLLLDLLLQIPPVLCLLLRFPRMGLRGGIRDIAIALQMHAYPCQSKHW